MSLTPKRKICSRCKKTKPVSEFYASYRSKDGFGYWCKTCKKKYQSTGKGKESHSKALRKYQQTEKGKVTQRKYQRTEKGKIRHKKYNREWYKRKVRGLLCDSCNHVLGMSKENVNRLHKAILYLENHR